MKICDVCEKEANSLLDVNNDVITDKSIKEICENCRSKIEDYIAEKMDYKNAQKRKQNFATEIINKIRESNDTR